MAKKRGQRDPDHEIEQIAHRDANLGWWLEIRNQSQDTGIDRDVHQSCERKDRYRTREAARAVAAMNGMADVLHAYECRYCLQWHLTRRRGQGA